MNTHRLLFPMLVVAILFACAYRAEAKNIGLFVNDRPVSFHGPAPFIKDGTTMVPLRTVGESLEMRVDWQPETRSIRLSNESIVIKFIIDEPRAEVNGKIIDLPEAPVIVQNRAFVPLRFIGEQLNKDVEWEPEQKNIFIMDNRQESDRYWLAKLVEAEAGSEPYEGKVAVAAVVVNRTKSPFFPQSIKSVIFERQQFTPVHTRRIFAMEPTPETMRAVAEALEGNDPSRGALYFYNPSKTNNRFLASRSATGSIGNHRFAR